MKKQYLLFGASFLAIIFSIYSCEMEQSGDSSVTIESIEKMEGDTMDLDSIPEDASVVDAIIHVKPSCDLEGEVLETNVFIDRKAKRLIAITATEDTKDADLGDSHRTLEVYDTEDCSRIRRGKLPINVSPDYPYYLAEINYNTTSDLLGIRGVNEFYIYDIENDKLQKLEPKYPQNRVGDEPSSGRLLRIEVWEDYLIGYAETSGAFVFDLSDKSSPKPILPLIDYAKMDDTYSCLFLLPSGEEKKASQVLIPQFNYDNNSLVINALMTEPMPVNSNIKKSFRNNRYVVLKVTNEEGKEFPCAIDMEKQIRIDLPAAIQAKKNTEIIDWIKSNQN